MRFKFRNYRPVIRGLRPSIPNKPALAASMRLAYFCTFYDHLTFESWVFVRLSEADDLLTNCVETNNELKERAPA